MQGGAGKRERLCARVLVCSVHVSASVSVARACMHVPGRWSAAASSASSSGSSQSWSVCVRVEYGVRFEIICVGGQLCWIAFCPPHIIARSLWACRNEAERSLQRGCVVRSNRFEQRRAQIEQICENAEGIRTFSSSSLGSRIPQRRQWESATHHRASAWHARRPRSVRGKKVVACGKKGRGWIGERVAFVVRCG